MQASKSRRRRAFAALGGVLLLATMVTGAQAQTYTYKDLYKFKGSPTDGSQPIAGVDPRFGRQSIWTTRLGGSGSCTNGHVSGCGTVFKISKTGHETVHYSFQGGSEGEAPYGGVTLDSLGNLYGTTYNGGPADAGAVYKLDALGNEMVPYSFTGRADGKWPEAGVTFDRAGILYGTTLQGGTGEGVVFKLDTDGNERVLYSFAVLGCPCSGVILDPDGSLYGTAYSDVLYQIDPTGNYSTLYSFCLQPNCADGDGPFGGVVRDSAGNLWGTTYSGGSNNSGVVYKLSAAGGKTVLYSFTGGTDGKRAREPGNSKFGGRPLWHQRVQAGPGRESHSAPHFHWRSAGQSPGRDVDPGPGRHNPWHHVHWRHP